MNSEQVSGLDIATFISILGLIGSIIWNSINLHKTSEIQKQSLIHQKDSFMHDMIKFEIENWKYIHEQKKYYVKSSLPSAVTSHIFNYYEYLAYLILNNKINIKSAKRIWKPNILNTYEEFEDEFLGERKELKKLYYLWKIDDEKENKC
jgi:hypothetical protein